MSRNLRPVLSALLAVGCLFSVVTGHAQQTPPFLNAPQVPDAALEKDPKLKRIVTLDEVGVPLKELLSKVSDKGLKLSCGSSCAEQKVQVRLKGKPLAVLMQSLAELLPGTWLPLGDGSGYKINMTDEAVRYRARWWEMFLGERERGIAAQRAYVLAKMREKVQFVEYSDDGTGVNSPEKADWATRVSSFYNLLPAALQEQIAAHMLTRVFSRKDGGTNFPQEDETIVALSELPQDAQRLLYEGLPSLQSGQDAMIAFCNAAISIKPRVFLPGKSDVPPDKLLLPAPFIHHIGFAPDAVAMQADQPGLIEVVKKRGKTAPLEWQRLAAYQQCRVWKNDLLPLQDYMRQPYRRAEILDWLGSKADIEFVADFYSQISMPLSLQQKAQKPTRSVNDELNYRASEQDFSWKQRTDKVYLVRNNRWYRDDNMEVPAGLLRQWQSVPLPPLEAPAGKPPQTQDLLKRIMAQLDRQVDIAANLTSWQISNGLASYVVEEGRREFDPEHPAYTWRPFVYIANHTMQDFKFMEFYVSLTPEMRQALLNGTLSYASLNAQQQQAQYLLSDLQALLLRQHDASPLLELHCEMPNYESISGYNIPLQPIRLFNFSLVFARPTR